MRILAIETSCDETALTVMECLGSLPQPKFEILGNKLLSQTKIHEKYGGVYPMLAKREHKKNLPILLDEVLKESNSNGENIDQIVVTRGPGLEPALWTGIEFAKSLGEKWGKPVNPVNHMIGHLWSALAEVQSSNKVYDFKKVEFPAIALLVSGGHTELLLVKDFDKYEIIGKTRDDAVGEAFDKVGRLLDIPYPAGPEISRLAALAREKGGEKPDLPSPMINSGDFDFSYSGLKTAVLYKIKEFGELTETDRERFALAFEEAAIEPLVSKTLKACGEFGANTILVGGGVSANKYLRQRLHEEASKLSLDLYLPPTALTTDNAIMIGMAAYVDNLTHRSGTTLEADGNLALQD